MKQGVPIPQLQTQDYLVREYCTNRRSTHDIADELGCDAVTVARALKRHKIIARPKSLLDDDGKPYLKRQCGNEKCGATFLLTNSRQKFCSPACRPKRVHVRKLPPGIIDDGTALTNLTADTVCEACSGAPVVIDHDHKTGKFRGYLCQSCNLALGLLKDDVDRLKFLLWYLSR